MVKLSKAVEDLKEELNRLQQAQGECVTESGYVLTHKRYQYNLLTQKAAALRETILYLQEVKG